MDEELNGGDDYNEKGCAFCGGLGHRVATCPKLEQATRAYLLTSPRISSYLPKLEQPHGMHDPRRHPERPSPTPDLTLLP